MAGLSSLPIKKVFKRFVVLYVLSLGIAVIWPPYILSLIVAAPIILIGLEDLLQKKQAIRRNFPVLGRMRYILENYFREEIRQYFIEDNTNGTPISREYRSLVYQRAKNVRDTTPFGTQRNVYGDGYEWMPHSIYATPEEDIDHDPKIRIGGPDCSQPYKASLLNISAMSFGSLSQNAILALNKGAQKGGFAHNTGEGAITPYHEEGGGDLIWQIGTGYFGCRTPEGKFNPESFAQKAQKEQVKMIEIKLSQGAKPGHGGILPAAKNTPEIAAIREVPVGTAVLSPPSHSTFKTPEELMTWIAQLRELSGGKPIGFKICIGHPEEFEALVQAMKNTGIAPDFITVDGAEGGTGAAPVEFTNSLGMPLRDGLDFVNDTLKDYDLREQIKVIASGKIISAFHIARVLALGADLVYSGRAMMLSIGCIQARECNTNSCPVGVATQKPELYRGLDVADKTERVYNFHKNTIKAFVELLSAAGLQKPSDIERKHILRRVSPTKISNYAELYDHN